MNFLTKFDIGGKVKRKGKKGVFTIKSITLTLDNNSYWTWYEIFNGEELYCCEKELESVN